MRMTDDELKSFLAEPRIARLATNGADGFPHLIATWYVFEDGWLYLFSGRAAPRVGEIKRDSKVALLIDDDHFPYKQVTLYGTAEVDESITDSYLGKICAKYLGPDGGGKYEADLKGIIDPVMIKVQISKTISWNYYTGGYRTSVPRKEG